VPADKGWFPQVLRLAVTVITKNEASNIAACLESVSFAHELIVVDSGSTDDTVALAQAAGATVIVRSDWQGFGVQKNRALDLATSPWVLSLDADERVTSELQTEILAALEAPRFDAYAFPRRSSFCGQVIRHSGWTPDRVTRLFRRGAARFSDNLVHERLVFTGPVGQFAHPVDHESYRGLEDVLNKANIYSTAGAADMKNDGKTAGLARAVGHAFWAFIRTYLLRRGFLDGKLGFVLAVSIAEGTYYRYLKLWLLNRTEHAYKPATKRPDRNRNELKK
jgi:glycosyltransferase involved in cell wall biosynthesis